MFYNVIVVVVVVLLLLLLLLLLMMMMMMMMMMMLVITVKTTATIMTWMLLDHSIRCYCSTHRHFSARGHTHIHCSSGGNLSKDLSH